MKFWVLLEWNILGDSMEPSISTVAAIYKLDDHFFENGIGNLGKETVLKNIEGSIPGVGDFRHFRIIRFWIKLLAKNFRPGKFFFLTQEI